MRLGFLLYWRPAAFLMAAMTALALSSSPAAAQGPPKIKASAALQIQAIKSIKTSRTAAQAKLESRLLMAVLKQHRDSRLAALPTFRFVAPDADGRIEVDIDARATADVKAVVDKVQALGGDVRTFHLRYRAIRAHVPLGAMEELAAFDGVRKVHLARKSFKNAINVSQGDVAHRAADARNFFGVTGAGVKICVLSDGVDSLAALQASGDLPPAVDVLPGQAGSGDEGSAMLEIVHDLAPGAQLGFATADPDMATFATNIIALKDSGCNIIADDVLYLVESPFQDLEIADAVNQVTAAGVLYFSSAGNEGNLDDSSSGTWEGNFNGNGTPPALAGGGIAHDFGDGGQSQPVTADSAVVTLHWTDPFVTAADDYDLYDMDGTLSTVFDGSFDTQDGVGGDDDSVEISGPAFAGERLVVMQFSGADRMFNLNNFRGTVQFQTQGCTRGHSAAAAAFSVAAVDVATAGGGAFTGGAANPVEFFSCDGPRRIFFDFAGNLLPGAPAGDFSATGGVVRQKPDVAAADGVATAAPGFNPFFGTSAAAPHAAAVAGLVKSAFPAMTPAQIRTALINSALDIEAAGVDRDSGAGIVMAFQTLQVNGATPQAYLAAAAPVFSQVGGDGDAFIEIGEDWAMSVPLTNVGGANATGISATLTSSTPGVVILHGTSTYPDLAPGAVHRSQTNLTLFAFTTTPAVPCGAALQFTLTVSYTGGNQSPQSFNFSVKTGAPGTPATFSYTGPAVPIPDGADLSGGSPGAPVSASLAVAGLVGNVYDVNVSIDGTACTTTAGATTVGIDHSFVSDLKLTLFAPGGSSVLAVSSVGGSGNNFCQTVLNDEGGGPSIQGVTSANAPFTGNFTPNLPLASLAGASPNGSWQLQAQDFFQFDTGNIRAFSVTITPAVCNATPVKPVVTATKAVTGGTLTAGGTVVYTITLTNSGTGTQPDNAGPEFTDTLPAQLTVGTPSASGGTVSGPGVNPVTWNGTIPPGGSIIITIPATIQAATPPGSTISNQGTVNYDPNRKFANDTAVLTDAPGGAANDPTVFALAGVPVVTIPTLSEWGLALLSLLLSAAAVLALRRRRQAGA